LGTAPFSLVIVTIKLVLEHCKVTADSDMVLVGCHVHARCSPPVNIAAYVSDVVMW